VELSAIDNLSLFGALYGLTGASPETEMGAAARVGGLSDRAKDRGTRSAAG